MDTRGIVIVWGSLFAIVLTIVLGFMFVGPWAMAARVIGIISGIAWFIGMIQLASAMNTDI